jgi:sigma-B regulation protein RsbU (phosphoserine phosphatase)
MADKILVIDDEFDILELVKLNLTADGFEVITASSGKEGWEKVKQETPDLILLDLMMPQMDGYEVMKKLNSDETFSSIPVIMLTALSKVDDKIKGLDAGADDYITKPFDLSELTARVKAVLKRTKKTKYVNPLMRAMGDKFTEDKIEQLAYHLETAAKIQRQLLPEEAPKFDGIEIAGVLRSSMMVAGDFYDFIPLDEERLGVAICDIRGKGLPAAMLMMMVRAILRVICREESSPDKVLKKINDILALDTEQEFYATMIYGILDINSLNFTYSNAGHCHPIKVNKREKEVKFLHTGGMILGIFDSALFEVETLTLNENDLLVFYTDGVTETENDAEEFYGEERLTEVIQQNKNLSAHEILTQIENNLIEFSGTQEHSDDLTIVAIKISEDVHPKS